MAAIITSKNHDLIRELRKLERKSFRDESGLFVVEGPTLIREAVKAGAVPVRLLFIEERAGEAEAIISLSTGKVQSNIVSRDLLEHLSGVVTSQGILGVFEHHRYGLEMLEGRESTLVVIADQVRDPGNLGSVFRLADATGADALFLTPGCTDPYNPKVVRSAAGAHFHIRYFRNHRIDDLLETALDGMQVLGLEADGEVDYLDLDYSVPTALVIGNEAHGISEENRDSLDATISIRMPGNSESLNVASAASVVLFEILRQRRPVKSREN